MASACWSAESGCAGRSTSRAALPPPPPAAPSSATPLTCNSSLQPPPLPEALYEWPDAIVPGVSIGALVGAHKHWEARSRAREQAEGFLLKLSVSSCSALFIRSCLGEVCREQRTSLRWCPWCTRSAVPLVALASRRPPRRLPCPPPPPPAVSQLQPAFLGHCRGSCAACSAQAPPPPPPLNSNESACSRARLPAAAHPLLGGTPPLPLHRLGAARRALRGRPGGSLLWGGAAGWGLPRGALACDRQLPRRGGGCRSIHGCARGGVGGVLPWVRRCLRDSLDSTLPLLDRAVALGRLFTCCSSGYSSSR